MVVSIIFILALCSLPNISNATSIFYVISPAAGSDELLEFTLDSIENETIIATKSAALTLNGAKPHFFTNSIAFSPDGELFGWSAKNTADDSDLGQLFTIDRFTGEITLVGEPQGSPIWVNGLAFDSVGTLYGLAAHLYSIDTLTGVRTQISSEPIGQGHRGLAIDTYTDTLYAWTGQANVKDQLLQINKTTGATTGVTLDLDIYNCCVGTEFDPDTGQLITIRGGNSIYSTDISTGDVSFLGRVQWNGNDIQSNSLAVLPGQIPEPSTYFLLVTGLLLFGLSRKSIGGKTQA